MIYIVWAAWKDFRLENFGQSLERKNPGEGMKAVIPSRGSHCPKEMWSSALPQVDSRLPARGANWWLYRLIILWTQAHKLLSLSRAESQLESLQLLCTTTWETMSPTCTGNASLPINLAIWFNHLQNYYWAAGNRFLQETGYIFGY